ncbi:ATP-binding protein [Vibrio sp. WJH972]
MSHQVTPHIFPFSAVQGQALFKLALLLTTVNPAIGGVLISGPRGCAKSTLAKAVTDLLPNTVDNAAQFVSLPLGASEEMLIGTLDLDHALQDRAVKFNPGLLQKAHQGVLYVDEVNLLPDHLVDQLLDVASSGVNIIERDGISHQHAARFTLIGTMNPDEGELRPQLQDRFGLMVELDNQYSVEERINIMKARQHFEQDSDGFCQAYHEQQAQLQQQISDAQTLLAQVTCDDACFTEIATRCQSAHVDGLRADIIMHRASLTHAAWCGRNAVTMEDIEQVAPLVLLHRMQNMTPPAKGNGSSGHNNKPSDQQQSPFSRPQERNELEDEQDNEQPHHTSGASGDWGAMSMQSAESQTVANSSAIELPSALDHALAKNASLARRHEISQHKGQNSRGLQRAHQDSQKPNWFSTLANSLDHWPPQRWVFKKDKKGGQKMHLILLDTSASTLTDSLSGFAKSVVKKITENAYLQRDKVTLLGFGNEQVEVLMKDRRAPKSVDHLLNDISAMGGTPFRLMLEKAALTIQQLGLRYPGISFFCYLITDGRTRADIHDLKLNVPTLLVDIEKSVVKRGRGPVLAQQLAAEYVAMNG